MYRLSIVYNNKVCNFPDLLNNRLKTIKDSINIRNKSYINGNETMIQYIIKDENIEKITEIKRIIKDYIAEEITDIILNKYQYFIMKKQLSSKDIYFPENDIKKIYNKTSKIINNGKYDGDLLYKSSKRPKILRSILNYLEDNNEINIEGFINFRLNFWVKLIENTVDKVIEDLIIEKELEEFINILKYFVDIQSPKIDTVNIIFMKNKKYLLYDKDMKIINNDFLKEIAKEMDENEMGYDDLLISSLITIAPENLILHIQDRGNDDIIKIICSIFNEKVEICYGCNICTVDNKINLIKED
ncbi:putative sporulation protein YtxC [Clostridium sp. D2Q-14]|uniref:putative sporulation protein YtxC n=1 Tax=Anaeromonas gelatinilytica TaxID=2683194 RepID=UPI00193C675C|nr:putative sporulation protein YtxC [Anaeromonas gelatinilytica]MBS4536285.1 putative sporulation protein YtxC [Anaeromonas gelatinilytica]